MQHLTKLENCDKKLMTKIFSVPITCSYESFYLETGCIPIRFILQGRRLMYYWTLLRKSNEELVKQVFDVQKSFSSKDDWINQKNEDKTSLNIDISEDSIKKMTKYKFKKLVKQKIQIKASEFLYNIRDQENRTKSKNLKNYKFQNYLKCNNISIKEKKLLFSLRTRTVDVKTNYRNKYKLNMYCRLCKDTSEEESERHLLKCKNIIDNIDSNIDISTAKYESIFSENIEDQVSITKIYRAIFKTQAKLLQEN